MYYVGINAGAQVAIILLACGPCVVIVNCWDRFCTLGRAPHTKGTLPDCSCVVSSYPTSTSIPWVDGLSTDLRIWGVTITIVTRIPLTLVIQHTDDH